MTRGHYGLLPTTPDARDYRFRALRRYSGGFVDLSEGIARVYDQGALGSCVSNGTAACVDFARKKQGLEPIGPSRLFIYYQGRVRGGYPIRQDTGLQIRDGLHVVAADGAPPETDWDYDISRFTEKPPERAYLDGQDNQALKYGQVDPDDIDSAIAAGFPVVQGFDVFESFEDNEVARTGIVPMPEPGEAELGGHCTTIVSTPVDGADLSQYGAEINGVPGVAYRKHLNSWGTDWGQGGFYWAPVSFTAQHASDFWTITSMEDHHVQPPVPPADADAVFATVLRPWADVRHVACNKKVAAAARTWLAARAL